MKSSILFFATAVATFSVAGYALPAPGPNPAPKPEPDTDAPQSGYGRFTACYSTNCSGDCGDTIDVSDGTCIKTLDRQSFSITGCDAVVLIYEEQNCNNGYKTWDTTTNTCYAVNIGTAWGSAKVTCK